jgi:hypothetical protein
MFVARSIEDWGITEAFEIIMLRKKDGKADKKDDKVPSVGTMAPKPVVVASKPVVQVKVKEPIANVSIKQQ